MMVHEKIHKSTKIILKILKAIVCHIKKPDVKKSLI